MGKKTSLTSNIMNSVGTLADKLQNGDNYSVVYIPYEKLKASKDNFYSVVRDEALEALADSIANDSLQSPLRIRPISDTDEYEIISGNRRYEAIGLLLERGDTTYKEVPCSFDNAADDIAAKIHLINANATTRVLSDAEIMKQVSMLKELYQAQKEQGIEYKGRTRDRIAASLNISKSQVGRYEAIENNLVPEFKKEFEEGKISFSTASELAGLPQEKQREIFSKKTVDEKVKLSDVQELKKADRQDTEQDDNAESGDIRDTEETETKSSGDEGNSNEPVSTSGNNDHNNNAKPKNSGNKDKDKPQPKAANLDGMIEIYLKTFFNKFDIKIESVLRYYSGDIFIVEVVESDGKTVTYEIKDDKPHSSNVKFSDFIKNIQTSI